MRRGSTPLITLTNDDVSFDGYDSVVFSDYDEIIVTYRQRDTVIDIDSSDMTIGENSIEFRLTQDDTLAFRFSNQNVLRQVKLKDEDGHVIVSDLTKIAIEKALNEDVI